MSTVELSSKQKITPDPWADVLDFIPMGFRLHHSGVSHVIKGNEVLICGPLWVSGNTRSVDGTEWGLILSWIDQDQTIQSCAVLSSRLHERGAPLAGELAARGLKVIPGKQNVLMTYLGSYELPSDMRQLSVAKLGWVDCKEDESPKFMTPDGVISLDENDKYQIMFQPEQYSPTLRTMRAHGTLGQWRTFVAELCLDHPVLYFSLCVAFTGSLLKFANLDCGGFHLYGASSKGKTTALQVAASVWGSGSDPANNESAYITRWNTTGNAMEAIAAAHNDGLLCKDELGTCDARDIGKVIYDLFGGRGKSRLNKSSLLQASRSWRIQGLSTGEISLKLKIEEGGGRAKTGQLIRMLDIPINDGVVENVCANPRKLIDELKANAERFYGVAGPAFIEGLLRLGPDNNAIRSKILEMHKWRADTVYQSLNLESPQKRAISRIDLVTVAGILAIDMGILPGTIEHVIRSTRYISDRWLADSANQPDHIRALTQLRDFILKEQARFRPADNAKIVVRDLVGYTGVIQKVNTYLFTDAGIQEATRGFNWKVVLEDLRSRGYLIHEKNRLTSRRTIDGVDDRLPLYAIKQTFLTDELYRD